MAFTPCAFISNVTAPVLVATGKNLNVIPATYPDASAGVTVPTIVSVPVTDT